MTTPSLSVVDVLELCQPLLQSARDTLRVFPPAGLPGSTPDDETVGRCNDALVKIGEEYGLRVPRFLGSAPEHPTSLEVALSTYCDLELGAGRLAEAIGAWDPTGGGPTGTAGPPALPAPRRIAAEGLPAFDTFCAGPEGADAVVLILPSGVPAALFGPWLRELSTDHQVITYENPYLFGPWRTLGTPEGDFAAETTLVGALLREYGLERAHLVGICGGAPVALAVAAEFADQVETLTVLHPDLNFGEGTMRTPFQKQFQSVLAGAASGPRRARETLSLFLDPNMLLGIDPRLAPFILYPYSDVELFHRYALQNHALMTYDANEAARRIGQRVLIATSRTDRMTHPETARHFGSLVAGEVTVCERESGTHHDILIPGPEVYAMLRSFIGGGAA